MKEYVNFELVRGGTGGFELALVPVTDTHRVLLEMVVGGARIRVGGARGQVLLAYVGNEGVHVFEALVTHSASHRTHPLTGERLKEVVVLGHRFTRWLEGKFFINYDISSCSIYSWYKLFSKNKT